ncbi:Dps family protein [Martelella endophytica]|uniref:DNA-binding protein n=1 Tax=Martelella endophytica TaxID=1486262 RepID=A0A0D5LPC3_MAREN|nr:DNA starvation/stationary phase protection protein [Martelella endophytica]AJY45617.1 DNA-binding protein [Martelella endophytica]
MAKSATVLKPKAHESRLNTGLSKEYRAEMAESLSEILGATYQLTIKSHIYHWNVVGPLFRSLHLLTEEHYGELFEAADTIAERIRAIGFLAPEKMREVTTFVPDAGNIATLSAEDMIKDLINDHEAAVRAMREAGEKAGDAGDLVTEDMLTARLTFHEKALWMLRAIIGE